jgi:shikimate kinase
MPRITLIGLMGAGKTAVGAALAGRLGWRFVDLDAAVECAAGAKIEDLFKQGEARFREVEAAELARALAIDRVVIATGGGAPCQPGAMDAILAASKSVWLDAPPEALARRRLGAEHRPALAGLNEGGVASHLEMQLETRRMHYERATVRIETEGRSVAEVVRAIQAALVAEGAPA